jgi:PKD repeat protein
MEVATMRRVALLALGLFAATPLAAQDWAFPAKSPNTDVPCTTCADKAKNQLTPGYPAAIGTYVGRYLDSNASNDCQQPVRTWRAVAVVPMPALNPPHGRLYFQIGSSVMAYDMDRFFQRVARGEPFQANVRGQCTQIADKVLPWDSSYYAEDPSSGWDHSNGGDGQTRLYWIDADDQGYVYLATKWYRWGIVKDNMEHDGGGLQFVSQPGPFNDDVIPTMVVALKGSNGAYYAVVGDTVSSTLNVFDVTDRAQPQKRGNLTKSIYRYAKNSDATVIGIATIDNRFEIYTTDAFVANGTPLLNQPGPGDAPVRGVASDGTNFFIASDAGSGLVITTYGPNGSGGYSKVADFPTSRVTLSTENLKWGDGYLVQAGFTDGSYELRLFKASSPRDVSEVDVSLPAAPGFKGFYFKNYYKENTTGRNGYVGAGIFGQFHDSQVVKNNGHTYLVVTGYGLGDVYELPGGLGSLSVTNNGSVGTPNPNRPAGSSAGPFYGDPIGFTATNSPPAAQTNIQWDFGNAEGVPGADPNIISGVTGQQASHRYSGFTAPTQLPVTRTVRATGVTNSSLTGSAGVTLAKPAVAVAIAGRSGSVTQASQLSAVPVVAGDRFVDASDGSVESHFDAWSIDGNVTKALPNDSVAAGACAASHTLNFDAHYGPYTGTPPTSLSDLPIGIHAATYSVRPFGASIATTPSTTDITFTAAVRTTSDTSIFSAAQIAALQYRWQLIDASNNVLVAGPSGNGAVPAFTAAKSNFTSRGIRARLTLTSSTAVGGSCAGLNMETAGAFTQQLNGPDPVVDGDCTAGGPPCSFRALSASSVDQAADGWTYAWSVLPATFRGATTGATFAPTFTAVGQYTVKLTVTNAIGTSSATKNISVTTIPPVCPPMSPGNNVFISYQSASGSCSFVGGACNANEPITFVAAAFNYDFACDTHTFTWDFGDGGGGSSKIMNHSYGAAGVYNVTLTIKNASETVSMSVSVTVGQPPPPCQIMVAGTNVFPAFSAASGCTSANTKPCRLSESINFAAGALGYDYSCAVHTFRWDFGDGTSTSTNAINLQHSYATVGTYNVSLTISNGTQTVSAIVPVKVANTKDCPPLSASSLFIAYNGPKSQCTYIGDTVCSNIEDVAFNAAPSLGFDASCVLTYQWDFGDASAPLAGASVTHKYAAAGKYDVKLTVTDGTTPVMYTATVRVRDDNPVVECVFDFTVEPRVVGGSILPNEFVFTITGVDGATAPSYEWDFGDGAKATTNSPQQTHPYADGNTYTVTLTVPGTNCRVQHKTVKPRRRAAGR